MSKTLAINGYKSKLDLISTEIAINEIKNHFESKLSEALNLIKVSAPLLLSEGRGINDNLHGVERIVSFDALEMKNTQIEIVQSLAKWKRMATARYGFTVGEGLYTNMNAIRRDEELDNLHSMYVDQWDWEKVISKDQRNQGTLETEVKKIYKALKATEGYMYEFHSVLEPTLPDDIYFISTYELEIVYPDLTPKQREDVITKEHGAVFIMQIGGVLPSGEKHDGRSPDYDDWTLNGDIIFWNPLLEKSFEISSMGIRVDKKALLKQLKLSKNEDRSMLEYHKLILGEKLPYTIGGGIGQSRLCMFFLKKAHIGEVQASVWSEQILTECKESNINLL
ncbi:aspartate--ammonia ligase [Cytobacillus sp. S13-E01]|uniref:aspartate--ammonia ligase n=1 Tax=Cytobacillus sp. S13-E01 TaxID=3031326 RepID=UPI0023D88C52|nr:aspartate--ammonia ligase [Cytobacillus sp. S13-E01]MDF0725492.1 aspartate--ammonia ligase [Cytobacillus sp. S13-E01]